MSDIKRALELFLCAQLTAQVPGHKFCPYSGFGDNSESLEPPFSVVAAVGAEKTVSYEGTYVTNASLQIINHADEATSEDHAALVKSVLIALGRISPSQASPTFVFHGLDITSTRHTTDKDNSVHADIIEFVCGVSG
jgi:hypothetical protein